jgi:hypothetical protein
MSDSIIIPSTTPGKSWQVSVLKFNSGLFAHATEVTVTQKDGWTSVAFTLLQARTQKIALAAKRRTERVVREGIAAMVAKLEAEGLAPARAAEVA